MNLITSLKNYRLKSAFKRLDANLSKLDDNWDAERVLSYLFSQEAILIRPWQIYEEFSRLVHLYEELKPRHVLEIGTANGGTLFMHCKLAAPDATIISVDLPEGMFGGGYPDWKRDLYLKFMRPGQKLVLLRQDSHAPETFAEVKKHLGSAQFDYEFIDGDHTYAGVKQDFEMYGPLAKPGATIVFHDIVVHPNSECKVDEFWEEIKVEYPSQEFISAEDRKMMGIGVIELAGA